MIRVNVLGSNKADEWNSLVERVPDSRVYHLWEWGEVLSSTYGYQRYNLAITQNDDIFGILPLLHIKNRLFGNRLISLPFCEYGGFLTDIRLNNKETGQVVHALLNATKRLSRTLGVEYVEIRNPYATVTQDLFPIWGYDNFQRYIVFKVDLAKEPNELWRNLHKKTRNAVRKAMKSEVETTEIKDAEQLKAYYKLYLQTQKRHGSPPHDYALFEKLYEAFRVKGKIKILLAEHRGKYIAGIIVFSHHQTIFWWNNVTDTKHRSLNATNLLIWNVIERGAKKGYRIFDLGRTRRETTIHRFKKRWGGQEIPLLDYVYFLNLKERGLPDPTQARYRYLSKLWFFLPVNLAKRIGPKIISGIAL